MNTTRINDISVFHFYKGRSSQMISQLEELMLDKVEQNERAVGVRFEENGQLCLVYAKSSSERK